MLKNWTSHAEYHQFITNAVSALNESQLKKFNSYSNSLAKLTSLNLDPLAVHLAPYYSSTGRPALHQPEIFRSFILMLDQNITSIDLWVKILLNDDLLALLIGCHPDELPPLGSYYDFIDRLWLHHKDLDKTDRNKLYHFPKNKRPSSKPGKGKKLSNRHPDIVKKVVSFVLDEREFPFHYEQLLQEIFSLIAIVPSLELNLFSSDSLTLSGDGTCVHCHSDTLGTKVCNCKSNGVYDCKCDRKFSDPDASFGWDSDLAAWYFGYTLYMLSTYNPTYHIDLPLHIRFLDARRHDSINAIVALSEFRKLNSNIPITNLCLDSANDNYPTYELCNKWNIIPFIDLNANRGHPKSLPQTMAFSKEGLPLCSAGLEMVLQGFCTGRSRHKWRCPAMCGIVDECPLGTSCSPSSYGRVVYTKPDWDVRLFPPVPRGTKAWKDVYSTRTSSERVNNRFLNDYRLHNMRIRGKKRYSFIAMMIGINIHLDARIKKAKIDAA
ncbi:MAG: hypothetical protein CVV02_05080 [Firmicutes bacterium HGW-Firmicutes-7]|nr:MAG: hypothetical protein CVV02_05080 [Firmicutes bacterium HGW-Firmicutes-7]